jgi:hypothetical protein
MEPSVRIEVVDWFTWMGVVVVSATSYGIGEIGGVAVAAVSVLGRGAGAALVWARAMIRSVACLV